MSKSISQMITSLLKHNNVEGLYSKVLKQAMIVMRFTIKCSVIENNKGAPSNRPEDMSFGLAQKIIVPWQRDGYIIPAASLKVKITVLIWHYFYCSCLVCYFVLCWIGCYRVLPIGNQLITIGYQLLLNISSATNFLFFLVGSICIQW